MTCYQSWEDIVAGVEGFGAYNWYIDGEVSGIAATLQILPILRFSTGYLQQKLYSYLVTP